MIRLGFSVDEKIQTITDYIARHGITKTVIISPARFQFDWIPPCGEWLEWRQVIEYQPFYRLLQELDARSLLVINECLRTKNRYDLTYNCIRHYLNQAGHQLIFQHFPLIDGREDFMILYDFETRSRWKRFHFDDVDLREADIHIHRMEPAFTPIDVPASSVDVQRYQEAKNRLFAALGQKDPHTLPRNLYLQTGKLRLEKMDPAKRYLGRNNRFQLPNMITYRGSDAAPIHAIFEWPHNHIDLNDALTLTRCRALEVLRANLPVDQWYWTRYHTWREGLLATYTALQ